MPLGLARIAPARRSGGGSASFDASGKVHSSPLLAANTAFIVYGNGVELGRAVTNGAGLATVTLASAPAAGTVFTYGVVLLGGTMPAASPAPGAGGGALDFSDPANSGHIPGI